MTGCDVIPLSGKACAGTCRGAACGSGRHLWVLASSDGALGLFHKIESGLHRVPLESTDPLQNLREKLLAATQSGALQQLVVVGSAKDIAWTHQLLPPALSGQVVAEIEYPLMAAWFAAAADDEKLIQVLSHIV